MTLKISLKLEGSLYWYEEQKRREISLEIPEGTTYKDLIIKTGLPLGEIAHLYVNGNARDLMDRVKNGETVLIMPVIGGG
jgi:sulfur carrier protein ThiS